MRTLDLRTAWTLLVACSAAIALIAVGPANVDAQPLAPYPGSSGSGMSFGSSNGTAIGPSGGSPFGWLSPLGSYWPGGWSGAHDPLGPHHWPGHGPGLFGDTALSLSNSLRFGVSDFSIVEMPEMIQPPPAEGWEPDNQGAANSVPRVEPPAPVAKARTVRAPLNVAISPERPAAEPKVSEQ